jgi:hypothetical protein
VHLLSKRSDSRDDPLAYHFNGLDGGNAGDRPDDGRSTLVGEALKFFDQLAGPLALGPHRRAAWPGEIAYV